MILLRKSWFRILSISLIVISLNIIYLLNNEEILRSDILTALKNSTLIFTLCAVLSIALFTNYIKGLRDSYNNQVVAIRDMLGEFLDKYKHTEQIEIRQYKEQVIYPLLESNHAEWDDAIFINSKLDALDLLQEQLVVINKQDPECFYRYILRLEDEFNKLGLLFVRRIATSLHLKTFKSVFTLIIIGLIVTGTAYLLPHTVLFDFITFNFSTLIFTFSVFELVILVGYLIQEAKEEMPEVQGENET
ncbi:membrane hypothetical protein [Pseudoalteromonas sp. 3J6]|uniref:hypothetical protein n=1 Tax=Pseudoalteromonas sp. 3J6 TaxID=649161 RepID=UPI001768E6A2|nr:hypothetical protein [Pseudoalteromonas sp. 3J6]CAD2223814.1 membrane hypothetical protein [Pseudoalteromonas sp. 3J6]